MSGTVKSRLKNLERRIFAMTPPSNEPVTFVFPDGSEMEFCNGHDALMYVLNNYKKDFRGVSIQSKHEAQDGFLQAIIATGSIDFDDLEEPQ